MEKEKTLFIDLQSVHSIKPLDTLVREAYSTEFPFFETSIGHVIKQWRKAERGDKVIYSIDDIGVCVGTVRFVKSRAFRPLVHPDHEKYKTYVEFARALCCNSFDYEWKRIMIERHLTAIEQGRWFFASFALISPTCFYMDNKKLLDAKVKELETAEQELDDLVACSFGQCL